MHQLQNQFTLLRYYNLLTLLTDCFILALSHRLFRRWRWVRVSQLYKTAFPESGPHDYYCLWWDVSKMMRCSDVNRVLCYFLMWFSFFLSFSFFLVWPIWLLSVTDLCSFQSALFSMFSIQICMVRAKMSNMFSRNATITFKLRWVDRAFKTELFLMLWDDSVFLPNESLYEYAWAYKHKFQKKFLCSEIKLHW